ncbi:MAG: hypothetical protein CI952_38 [Methanohalophilus sp.]|nr:MAG: hypothetical protein CI952_38 [Methanohalophilus sp.]
MAFAYEVTDRGVFGDKKYTRGTYTNALGDTGGDINTGLGLCEMLILQPTGASAIATAPVVNEILPVDGSAVTVVTADDEDGMWIAFGN